MADKNDRDDEEWIISIDVGIKNLAICVFSRNISTKSNINIEIWDVVNISVEDSSVANDSIADAHTCTFIAEKAKEKNKSRTPGSKGLREFFGGAQTHDVSPHAQPSCCGKPAKYFYKALSPQNDHEPATKFFCKVHAKKSQYVIPSQTETPDFHLKTVKKMKLQELQEYFKRHPLLEIPTAEEGKKAKKEDLLDAITKFIRTKCLQPIEEFRTADATTASKKPVKNVAFINLAVLGRNMMTNLDRILSRGFDRIRTVVIENQISPIAQRMSSLQGMLTQYFIMRVPGVVNIVFASSTNKLKVAAADDTHETTAVEEKSNTAVASGGGIADKKAYVERKKKSIDICTKLITQKFPSKWLEVLNNHKKKDDMCDSFLQGMWYLGQ